MVRACVPQRVYTPLHIAAENGHTETCTMLISKGAEVNAKTKARALPLLFFLFHAMSGLQLYSLLSTFIGNFSD